MWNLITRKGGVSLKGKSVFFIRFYPGEDIALLNFTNKNKGGEKPKIQVQAKKKEIKILKHYRGN